jgi:NAD(P)-dependent dehydrogenase (short-subunit alcohol dehydrogenase family)
MRSLPYSLFDYPCVDLSSDFLKDKKVFVENSGAALAQKIIASCAEKGALICAAPDQGADILIINSLSPEREGKSNEETYFKILFYYINPTKKVLPSMLEKNKGAIIYLLPSESLSPSVDYAGIAAFTAGSMVKGLAWQFAGRGITVNGVVIDDKTDRAIAARWVLFLISGNARHITGELVNLTCS